MRQTDTQQDQAREHTAEPEGVPEAGIERAPSGKPDHGKAGDVAAHRILHGAGAPSASPFNHEETKLIQVQLERLGLYHLGIDGIFGSGSRAGLVEAFGGDEWKRLDFHNVLLRLGTARPPSGQRGIIAFATARCSRTASST